MDIEGMLSARMSALWFTYVSIFVFGLMPNFNVYLELLEILSIATVFTAFINLWSIYREKPLIDKRKEKLATNGMAWGFVTVSLIIISAGTTNVELNVKLLRDTVEIGLWTWLLVFSVTNLYQGYRGKKNE